MGIDPVTLLYKYSLLAKTEAPPLFVVNGKHKRNWGKRKRFNVGIEVFAHLYWRKLRFWKSSREGICGLFLVCPKNIKTSQMFQSFLFYLWLNQINLINHIAPALLVPLVTNLSMTGIDAMDERSVSFKGKCCYNSDFLSLLTDCKKWNEVWHVSCPSKIWIDLGSSRRNIMNVSLGAISNWNILPSNINHCQSD